MNSNSKAYLELHIAVVLYGFTAILGKLLDLSAFMIVWWRVLLTALSIVLLIAFSKKLILSWKPEYKKYLLIGILVAIHWLTFYGSIKYSNASIALICLATTSMFTSFIEPLILKTKIKWYQVAIGIIIVPAMGFVVSNLDFKFIHGVWLGIISAIFASLFTTLNKKYIDSTHPYLITFLEMSGVWLFLTVLLPVLWIWDPNFDFFPPDATNWTYMTILVLLCTTLAFILSLRALKQLSAFASTLVVNLEPVYGVILAALLLNEQDELNFNFYIGSAIIIFAVLLYPFLRKKLEPKAG